jgi:type I restriction enzyme S subunit
MNRASVTGYWNIPWLHALPDHWQVVSSKRLFSVRKELARSDDEQLAATQAYGVILQREYERRVGRRVVQITQNLEKRRHVERDDFVISMRSFEGGLERAWAKGCIRSSYVVLRPGANVHVGFFKHLFKSHNYIQALRATSNFIRDGQDLNMSNFSLVDLPLPPKAEQALIARYLDNVDGQVLRFTRAKKKLIALLNEQKHAIVHRAVTRGLDPSVRFKPSGIPWIGDVPEPWDLRRLRHFADLRVSNVDKKFNDGEIPVRLCNYIDVYRNDKIDKSINFMSATASALEIERFRISLDDVIITKDSEDWRDIGVPCYVSFEAPDLICGYHLAILRPIKGLVCGRFLYWQLLGGAARWQFSIAANGVTRYGLSHGAIKEAIFVLPPMSVQRRLAAYLDDTTLDLRAAERALRAEIALMQEHRSRLVADVVTGKLDVRAAAMVLPEKTESEPVDEPIGGEDLEETVDDVEDKAVAA